MRTLARIDGDSRARFAGIDRLALTDAADASEAPETAVSSARAVPATSTTRPHGVRAEPQWRRMAPDVDTIYAILVGALIRRRVELGLTQADVDHRAGFADCLTAKYETGIRRPSAYALCVWVCTLNATIAFAPLTLPEPVRETD